MSEPEKTVANDLTPPKPDGTESPIAKVAAAVDATPPATGEPATALPAPIETSAPAGAELAHPAAVTAHEGPSPAEAALVAASPLAPVQPAPAPAIEPSTIEPPVPSGPYRTPPYEPPPPRLGPKPWPILGPALSSFGAFLWTFVVVGQFTTSWSTGKPLEQSTALGAVALVSVVAWGLALRRSRLAAPPSRGVVLVARGLASALLAVLFFGMCVFAAVVLAEATRSNHDLLVAFVLVALSVTAVVIGGRITAPEPPERSHGQKFVTVAVWVVSLLLTIVAGADLASNG